MVVTRFPSSPVGRRFMLAALAGALAGRALAQGTPPVRLRGTIRRLQLTDPGGEKTMVVPPEAPVVSLRPGSRELLVAGAAVSLSAAQIDGQPTVTRASAGRNGFASPY